MSESTTPAARTHPNSPHPLQFKWTLWHDVASTKRGVYAANLRPIASFETVEDFWALFNNLKEPSQLSPGNTYNLFKHGIKPEWEDENNMSGGEWRVALPSSARSILDEYWVNTTLTVIGEGFGPEDSDDIAGIVVNIKKGAVRIAIWTKSASNEQLQMSIGRRWRETANITSRMDFISFKDLMGGKSKSKSSYVLE